jgi:putative heme-binding domain-containing protein
MPETFPASFRNTSAAQWRRFPLFFVLTAGVLFAQHGYTPNDVEDGQRLFSGNCVRCHGPDGDQVPGVNLGHGKFSRASSDEDLIKIIRNGIPGTAMPPSNYSEVQAGTIVAYLRSMKDSVAVSASASGDPVRGKAIFEGKGNCINCHRVNGSGSRMGPDLTDVGAIRRAVQLERSIFEPDAEVLPQNRFYRATLKDGSVVTGRLLNQDVFTIQMLDSRERLVTYEKAKLKEFGFVNKSPMPSYKDKLTTPELADVVSYLVSLKGVDAK